MPKTINGLDFIGEWGPGGAQAKIVNGVAGNMTKPINTYENVSGFNNSEVRRAVCHTHNTKMVLYAVSRGPPSSLFAIRIVNPHSTHGILLEENPLWNR